MYVSVTCNFVHYSIDKDDSCNGSKTQSATTTESNTPENTVRLDGIDMNQKAAIHSQRQHQYTLTDTGELVVDGK